MINRRNLILLSISAVITGLLAALIYEYHLVLKRLEHVESVKPEVVVTSEPAPIIKSGHPETWATVQTQVKDTVVQVFSQIAEVDLLQPYKIATQGQSFGSGFFINEEGEIVTNAHVIINAQSVWIQIPSLGKRIIDVDIVGVCPDRDLALLRLTPHSYQEVHSVLGKIPFLPLGDSNRVLRSDEVLTLGYPLAQHSLKSSTGVVSGRERINTQHFIQTSAPINPGNSGGPALNRYGSVIGVNTAYVPAAQNVGYIIPINELKVILNDLRAVKLLRKPFLGLIYIEGNESLTTYLKNPLPGGCYAVDIYKSGLLEKAGVKPGDMLYEIDGYAIDLYAEMNVPWSEDKISIADYVSCLQLGQKIKLVLYRNGVRKEITFTFELPQALPVRLVYPCYETIDYEILGGLIIAPLTLNHVGSLISSVPELIKYSETRCQQEPALIITHIFPDSQAHRLRAMTVGSIVTEVNGKKVQTLADMRSIIKKNMHKEFITIKTNNNLFTAFPVKRMIAEEQQLSRIYHYPITPFMQEVIKSLEKISSNKKS